MSSTRKARRLAKKPTVASALLSTPPPPATAARAFSQCIVAIQLIEVTRRSLAHQEIGEEQAALRCAQQAMWVTHDFLFPLQRDEDADGDDVGAP